MKSKSHAVLPTDFKYSAIAVIALAMIFSLFPQTIPNYPISSAAANGGVTVGSGICQQTVDNNTNTSVVVSQSGTDCIVTFRYVGTINWTAPAGVTNIQLLAVGGGGGGGGGSRASNDGGRGGGGGGAGGSVYFNQNLTISPTAQYAVTVGSGGLGGNANNNSGGVGSTGLAGSASSVTGTGVSVTASGGGAGTAQTGNSENNTGGDGGATSGSAAGATTNRSGGVNSWEGAGGGAGAGANGANGTDIGGRGGNGGNGGAGYTAGISGTNVVYGGGGGGGGTAGDSLNGTAGRGGTGGGGNGGIYQTSPSNGGNQVGGGGGGGGGWRDSTNVARAGAAGGSGIVIIRYTPSCAAATTGMDSPNDLILYLDAANACSTGTAGRWRDISGNGRDLLWANSPALRTADPKFYDFTRGNSHYGSFNSSGLTSFTEGLSISFFAKFDTAAAFERIIDFGNGAQNNNIIVYREGTTSKLGITVYNGSSLVLRYESPDQMIVDGEWAHYAITVAKTSADPVQMYRNGQLQTSLRVNLTANAYLPTTGVRTNYYLGRSNWSADTYFDGGIGSLAIYNKEIDSAAVLANSQTQSRSIAQQTTITDGGTKYNAAIFTSVGTNQYVVPDGVTSIDVLAVGGGGGAGFGNCGGGGGAGRVIQKTGITVAPGQVIEVFVGGGGTGGWRTYQTLWTRGTNGIASTIKIDGKTYTASGGGGGGGSNANFNGNAGGSGGGGVACGASGLGGAADTSAVSADAGALTGFITYENAGRGASGSGGGGGGAGGAALSANGGAALSIWGAVLAGGGGGWGSGLGGAVGSTTVGGRSFSGIASAALAGTPGVFSTGSGGGGGNNGASGRVAIRFGNPCDPTGTGITATGERVGNDCVISITAGSNSTWNVPNDVNQFKVLVVGGGGGGGYDAGAGGGGGAIYIGTVTPQTGTGRTAAITIGAGGNASRHSNGTNGSAGGSSIFSMDSAKYSITSPGGGLGGNSGASTGGAGGVGGVLPTISDTSTDVSGSQSVRSAGGAGGAGVPYNSTTAARNGAGGITQSNSDFFPGSYGGGGGGGATQYAASNPGRVGGAGTNGGGNGSGGYDSASGRVTSFATAGSANTGGGGGGGSAHGSTALYSINGENWYSRDAKAGGSGIIKIRFSLVPDISLSTTALSVGQNDAVTSYSVINAGNSATYSISPNLPAGFTLNTTTGQISGQSATDVASATYTLTATNSYGSDTATFTLQVVSGSKPIKPVIDFIAPGDAQLKVKVTPPVTDPVITGYRYSLNGGAFSNAQALTNSFLTISGVTNTTSYAVRIIAINAVGESVESDPVSSTPYPACPTKTTNTASHVIVEITSTTTCSWAVPSSTTAEMLVVGGGGGGGYGWGGGGGGGGVLHSPAQPLVAGDAIVVNVGNGGAGGTTTTATSKGTNGEDSTVNFIVSGARTTYTAIGGGGGGGYGWGGGLTIGTGRVGGSSGGHGEIPSGTSLARVNGVQLSIGTFVGYANAGGSMYGGASQAGSGGGGAGGDGGNVTSFRAPGAGGAGKLFNLVSEEGVYYAGGGGGGSVTGAAGGIGGGGRGSNTNSTATAGTNGLGGGGGGASNGAGASGGSGIVIIKYANNASKTTFDAKNNETPREIAQATFTASPFTPVKLGYTFAGWFTAETGGSAITYPYTSNNTTVYAQWTAKVCAVEETTFVGNGTNGGTNGVNYRVFRFTTPGDCIWSKPQGLTSLNVLAVGGGGGGGSAFDTGGGGGGAAGQVRQQTIDVTSITELVIAVGAGGAGGRSVQTPSVSETAGSAGLASELYANGVRIVNALGGDGGSASRTDYFIAAGLSGRNVGTGGASGLNATQARGGSHGGNVSSATSGRGGGGGGAGGVGSGGSATFTSGGPGGIGVSSTITGTATTYGTGGTGGRGSGTNANRSNGSAGATNLGNGGGGASAGPSSSFNGGAGGSGIVILRAEVTGERYTVTYNTTGGTALTAGSFVAGGTVTQPANPIRAGYTLSGWSLTDGGTALTFPYTPPTNQNLTLFALWSANQISVVFNANDGTTTTKVQNVTAGTRTALAINTFERIGYTFVGWSANANGTGTQFADEDNVTLLAPTELYAKWEANELVITFDKNDGSEGTDVEQVDLVHGAATPVKITAGALVTLRSNASPNTFFSRAGYVFSGWTNSAGEKVGDGAQVRIFVNTKYFANWTPIEFTVTYNLNGGAGTAPTQANVAAGGTFTVADAPTRTGYTFAGWSDGSVLRDSDGNVTGSKLYQAGETYTVGGSNVNLIAQWDNNAFIVYYSENGGTGTLPRAEDRFRTGDSPIVLPGRGTLVKTGFTFGGWSATDSGASVGATYTPSGNATLYAVWTANTYTISYNGNGHTGGTEPTATSYVYSTDTGASLVDNEARVAGQKLVRTNYTFGGWSTSTSGSAVATPYQPTANVTLYAIWVPVNYTFTYNLNTTDTTSGTLPDPATVTFNSSVTLASGTSLTRTGSSGETYDFLGWSATINGNVIVGDYRVTGDVTLYAIWKRVYTITYNLNTVAGDTVVGSAPSSVRAIVGQIIQLPSGAGITRTGAGNETYVLGGWSTTSNNAAGSVDYSPSSLYVVNAFNPTLYAIWVPAVTIRYVLNGGEADASLNPIPTYTDETITTAITYTLKKAPVRNGYTFVNWQVDSYNNGIKTSTTQNPDETITITNAPDLNPDLLVITAIWQKTVTIIYDANGGTGAAEPATNTYTLHPTIGVTLAGQGTLVKADYSFAGWSTTINGNPITGTYRPAADVTLYAVWNGPLYSISYDIGYTPGQNEENVPTPPATTSKLVGEFFTVASAISRTNYTFAGWSTGGNTYFPGATLPLGAANVTLTALWTQTAFTINYDLNGGTVETAIPTATVNAGSSHTFSTEVVSRTGYTFTGWSLTPTGSALAGATYTPTQNVTLYAVWTAISKKVTYAAGVAGTSTIPAEVTGLAQGESVILAPAMTDPNRPFLGWSDGTSIYLPGQSYRMGAADVTMTAQWGAASYVITYDLNGGSGTAPTQTPVASGGSFTIKSNLTGSTPLFTRANHEFDGWLIGADAKAIGAVISNVTTNVTVQAKWNPVIEVEFNSNGGTAVANPNITYRGGAGIAKPTDPTRTDFVFGGWSDGDNIITTWPYVPALPVTLTAVWTQLSLAGIDLDMLVRLGTLVASDDNEVSFTGSNPTNSVNVVVPAGSLPAGTKVNIDVVSEIVRAKELISNEVDFLVSLVVHWLAEDGTVPKTDPEKPVLVTIYNPAIKTGMVLYKIIGDQFTVMGRAAEDGVVTFEIFEDPEILVAATRPDAPVEVAGVATSPSSITVSWVAPAVDGGADITGYTVTASSGQSCTSTSLSCVITGLSASTPYTFTVIATNSVGDSAQSAASAEITTNALPPAPGGAPVVPVVPTRPTPTGPVTETIDNRPTTTPPGAARRIVDGSVVSTIFQVINTHTIRTQFEGVTLDVRGLDRIDRNIPISNNTLVFERNGKAALSGSGLMGNTKVRVWLLSTPTFLGEVTTKSDGSFNLSSVIPRAFPLGNHTLQINGVSEKNQLITQTFGVTVVEKAPESTVVVPGTAKKALNLSMVPSQTAPTTKQLAKTTRLATTLPAKSVITCNSYVAAARPTAAQIRQATSIANLLCAPFKANKELTTKFTKKAPKNAATLKWAKRKPIRVEVTINSTGTR